MDIQKKFSDILNKQVTLSPSKTVVLAVSGGVDSMVLLHLMMSLPENINPQLVVCHVNHKLRKESDEEQEFLEKYLSQYDISYETAVWEKKNHPPSGIEEAGRRFRYTFFKEIMVKYEADVLMTGHHQNDQAETVLMRLVRGGRFQRLKGIELSSDFYGKKLVRPLLSIEKNELYDYAEQMQVPFMEDVTNQEKTYTRNRFRNEIIPLLQEENNQAVYHIAQTAKDIQNLQKILQNLYDTKIKTLIGKNKTTLSRKGVLGEEEELGFFIFSSWLSSFFEDSQEEVSPETLGNIFSWLQDGEPHTSWDLPGSYELYRDYDWIHIRKKQNQEIQKMTPFALQLNTWHRLPQGEMLGLFKGEDSGSQLDRNDEANYVIIDASHVALPLWVRNRQDGDRMSLKGTHGSKKVKDIFIDQKIPLEQRDKAYVVVDNKGDIIWLINYKESELSKDLKVDTLQYILIYKEEEETL